MLLKILLILLILMNAARVMAIDGILLSYGQGMNDLLIQYKNITGASQKSVGLFWDTSLQFNHSLFGYSELEVELYAAQIDYQQRINILAVRPIFSFYGNSHKERNWYWQFGVGLSYFDSKQFDPVTLSTNGQFATIFGLGMPLDEQHKHRLTLRYNHYSNGYIKQPNQGIDILSLDWHVRF